ncbi:glycosyltransferase family 2 protein [Nitrosomonas supralitoralis]|uniref:Glycosyl transferase n=1 Tax=Nitrosomonas supralitoralis TaxID=2116706 RepID=A0A2P7NRW6_9PROT|nr:glycosyltransferase [Nitrosomonas supralitoralis]PSJ16197.1 glycosyl transferase [Nitrosomonas supralitoralis]
MNSLIKPPDKSIDVVIPVYNAPELTKCCIDSVVANLGQSIRRIIIQDDASDMETREMLDGLPYDRLEIFHAEQNQGFGVSVNAAVNRSDAFYVLILNSDTEVSQDFLPLLCSAFEADPRLAVIIPAGNSYEKYDFNRYIVREGGYIQTHYLRGHAILVRRDAFQEVGGFDPSFGRGYYEDIDLGRRLDLCGWHYGVHPHAFIYHKGGASFGRERVILARRNRAFYLLRYPTARRNILLLSGNCSLVEFPSDFLDAIEVVCHEGGSVHWFTPELPSQLVCLQMYNHPLQLSSVIRVLLRGWKRADRRISEIWIMPGVPHILHSSLAFWAHLHSLKVLSPEEVIAQSCAVRMSPE